LNLAGFSLLELLALRFISRFLGASQKILNLAGFSQLELLALRFISRFLGASSF